MDTSTLGTQEESAVPGPRPPYPPEFRKRLIELARAGRKPKGLECTLESVLELARSDRSSRIAIRARIRQVQALSREFEPSAQAIRNWVMQAGFC